MLTIEKVKSNATHKAAAKKPWLFKVMVNSYTISDNPHDRKGQNKFHVAWHNAFYAECKRLNRQVN